MVMWLMPPISEYSMMPAWPVRMSGYVEESETEKMPLYMKSPGSTYCSSTWLLFNYSIDVDISADANNTD